MLIIDRFEGDFAVVEYKEGPYIQSAALLASPWGQGRRYPYINDDY